jgi:hypothetical protein
MRRERKEEKDIRPPPGQSVPGVHHRPPPRGITRLPPLHHRRGSGTQPLPRRSPVPPHRRLAATTSCLQTPRQQLHPSPPRTPRKMRSMRLPAAAAATRTSTARWGRAARARAARRRWAPSPAATRCQGSSPSTMNVTKLRRGRAKSWPQRGSPTPRPTGAPCPEGAGVGRGWRPPMRGGQAEHRAPPRASLAQLGTDL